MPKGQNFERQICKELSLWLSKGQRDDLFWRTAGSGGRATTRQKKGKNTAGAAGDICSTDPDSAEFCRFVTFELKRGYNHVSLMDTLDMDNVGVFCQWIHQAKRSAKAAQTPYWLILHKRDKRLPLVYLPMELGKELKQVGVINEYVQFFNCSVFATKITVIRWDDFIGSPYSYFRKVMRVNNA